MKKTYTLQNLGCANCAAKMERKIGALPGVSSCAISFMTAKMWLEADEGSLPAIEQQADNIIRRIERDARLVL